MKYWLWLSQLPGVGPILQKRLLETFITPEEIHNASVADLIKVEGIGQGIAEKIIDFRVNRIFTLEEKLEKLEIKIITSQTETKRYKEVFSCKRAPVLFFYRGELPLDRGLAIVGSRRCTEDAKRAAEEIAQLAAQAGVAVISGLAKGVDSYAHTAALKSVGKTMAVLGCGVDICYPPEHKSLYQRILADGGAVLSAFPPGTRPHPKFFLERNSHISAWSTDIFVIQAAIKSGALTTAEFALEQGRDLHVVPHSIYLPEAKGSNLLLEQGARPYLGPSSLRALALAQQQTKAKTATKSTSQTSLFNFQPNRTANTKTQAQLQNTLPNTQDHTCIFPITPAPPPLTAVEKKVIDYLKPINRSSIDHLATGLAIPEIELTPTLILMEINNLIKIRGTTVSLL